MSKELHNQILTLVREYYHARHAGAAADFPTTVAPIVQYGCVPVFLDVDLATGNVLAERLEEAIGPRTRAVMLAHTLGNPFDVDAVMEVVRRHELYFVEDNCDALGSQ